MKELKKYLHGHVLVLNENAPAREAARAMFQKKVGSGIVFNGKGKLAGIVTDRDLATQILGFGADPELPIRAVMSKKIFKCTESAAIADVTALMEKHGVRRIPVVKELKSGKEKCLGIITTDDLIAERDVDIETLGRIIERQFTLASPRRVLIRAPRVTENVRWI